MPRPLAVLGSLAVFGFVLASAQSNVLKIPVTVDQQGKSIYFVTDEDSDVLAEANRFCSAHLPTVDADECAANLYSQVAILRKERAEAQFALPGLTFTVNNANGETVRFVHEEGANPADEARAFCQEHFPSAPESDCVEAMLQNAKRALDEIQSKQEL